MNDLKISITREVWGRHYSVRIGSHLNESTGLAIAQPLQFIPDIAPEIEPRPAFTLTQNDTQLLMDELWHVGIRPTEGTGSAGAMAAAQEHLKDMRRLVFEQHQISQNPASASDVFIKDLKKLGSKLSDDGK